MSYYIKIGNKYYGGEADGYYDKSNQTAIMGGYNAWNGDLGVRANAPKGVGRYSLVDALQSAEKLSKRSIPEIIGGILDRQNYGYIEKCEITIQEEQK